MAEQTGTPADAGWRHTRRLSLVGLALGLLPLISLAMSVPRHRPAWLGALSLAGFALTYLAVTTSVFYSWSRTAVRLRWTGLGLLTVLGVVLPIAYRDAPGAWLITTVYVGLAGVVVLPRPRATTLWVAGAVATQAAILVGFAGLGLLEWANLALLTVLICALTLSMRRRDELIAHLHHTRAELAASAVETERLRFSRDLHDLLGHTLSLIVVKAQVAGRAAERDPALATEQMTEIEQIGRRALTEVREAVAGYRVRPFAAELDAARTALTDADLRVTVRGADTPLPAPADDLFGWVVREAATNVIRHSRARHCEISLRRADGEATLEVRDDGVGGPAQRGAGLDGLAGRLAAAGGRLDAGGGETGWRVVATVPERP